MASPPKIHLLGFRQPRELIKGERIPVDKVKIASTILISTTLAENLGLCPKILGKSKLKKALLEAIARPIRPIARRPILRSLEFPFFLRGDELSKEFAPSKTTTSFSSFPKKEACQ